MISAVENSSKFQTQQKVQPQWEQHQPNFRANTHKKQTLKNVCDDGKLP
jgi:hypothetical protein